MADWTEIEKLQEAFQRTQKTTASQKLSERNCIELLSKLQEMKLLDVIHTQDGKEYLTPKHLAKEIRDEIYVHNGRVNLVEIQQALNVDFTHIEAKSNELVKSDRSLQMIYGQLIQSSYLDQLAEDINDTLQSAGQMTLAEISKSYDLPGDFLYPELKKRIGKIINGKFDEQNKDAIFTDSFIARHKAGIRGILSAVTRPLTLSSITSDCDISIQLLISLVDELLTEGRIKGQLAGGKSEKSTFLPSIHTQTQNHWIDNFYAQNNYVEFDAVARLGISDPPTYLKRRMGTKHNLVFLKSLCIGQQLVDRVISSVENMLLEGDWMDALVLLPTSFTDEDCHKLLLHIQQKQAKDKAAKKFLIFGSTFVCNPAFVDSCQKYFDPIMSQKAEKEAKKASVLALTEEERREFLYGHSTEGKLSDRKEERRKKANEGSGSVKRDFGGAGIGSREVKTKGKDKKRLKWKKEQEGTEDKVSSSKQKSAQAPISFLNVDEICDVLQEKLPQCPELVVKEVAEKLERPLQKAYEEVVKSVFLMSSQRQSEQEKGQDRDTEAKGKKPVSKSRRHYEEEINSMWTIARLSSESFKHFNDEVSALLQKHLLKSVCTDLANSVFMMMANEYISNVSFDTDLNHETRLKMLPRFPENIQIPLSQLNNSLSGKLYEGFCDAIRWSADKATCSFMLKGADKKKDRQTAHGHKISLLKQLDAEKDPALALHLCCSVIFQTVTGNLINAPGKCVPDILQYISQFIERSAASNLFDYQDLVMKKVLLANKSGDIAADLELVNKSLQDGLTDIQKLASTTKKKQAT